MDKKIARIIREQEAVGDMGTIDGLRALAGYPLRGVDVSRRVMRHRAVDVQRDRTGQVIGSIEHVEEMDVTDIHGVWQR